MSSTEFAPGKRVTPLERDPNTFAPADSIIMPHAPREPTPAPPRPDFISDGTEPPPSTWPSDRNAL
jgi:hypothetical protein